MIIPTLRRPESLAETLDSLRRADRAGIEVRIIVVDNAAEAATQEVVRRAADQGLAATYLTEPRPAKGHCINRALAEGPLGEIVAVIDDDISVEEGWFHGVCAITRRWPDKGFYTGCSHIVWPEGVVVPAWAGSPELSCWAFSVMGTRDGDREIDRGRWVSGNHFWMRSAVIQGRGIAMPDDLDFTDYIELSEQRLMLELTEAGLGGVIGPDAVVGHRIQPGLLDLAVIRRRAERVGRGFAEVRMRPWRACSRQAVWFRRHPRLGRWFSRSSILKWRLRGWLARRQRDEVRRVVGELDAIERVAFYREVLRWADALEEYRG